ncbi:RHS repeat-associated protein, partial [Oxalobacteraceae bacterium GrIS 1.18]
FLLSLICCHPFEDNSLNYPVVTVSNRGSTINQRNEAWNQGITGGVTPQSFSEGFTYDGLNRIFTSTVANQAQQLFTYSVDGNILSNPTAGTYVYTGGTSGGPHAVKSISGAPGTFTYDPDGNQLTGNSRTNTWTSFDMPLIMAYSGNGASNTSQFTYGPNHERRTQMQGTTAITYYGGSQEVLTDATHNVTEIKTYWPMGLGVEIDRPVQVASELDWTHTDHLGSVIAITDIDGNLKEALGYDTWGNRRNAAGAPVSIATTKTAQINETTDNKGYTGEEQITSLELVHLNGRVYDPLVGKFLSPDPHVTDPVNGQSYNRYAYVLNNPMNLTDPTGFDHTVDDWYFDGGGGGGGGGDYGGGNTDYYGGSGSTSDSSPKEVTPEQTGSDSSTKTEQKSPTQQVHDSEGWSVAVWGNGSGQGASVSGGGGPSGGSGDMSGGAGGATNNTSTGGNPLVPNPAVPGCMGPCISADQAAQSGGVNYLNAAKAGFGVVGNGLGVFLGLGVAAAGPEGINQALGAYLVASSAYGVGTNSIDFAAAIGLTSTATPSNVNSLSRAIANVVDPGSFNAQRTADVFDLFTALGAGRVDTYTRMFATTSGPFISDAMTVTRTWGIVPQQTLNGFGIYQIQQNLQDAYQH